jgi:hypothetical protein
MARDFRECAGCDTYHAPFSVLLENLPMQTGFRSSGENVLQAVMCDTRMACGGPSSEVIGRRLVSADWASGVSVTIVGIE